MDRAKFDNFLISLIPKNVEIFRDSTCKNIEKKDNIYEIEFQTNGSKKTIQSKIVIGADGAHSIVRKTFYPKRKICKYFAIQEWYENHGNSPFYSCIFDKTISKSYCWTISKDNNFVIGGAFPLQNCNERFEKLKEKMKNSGISLGKLTKREGCNVFINKGISSVCTGKNGVYMIGEAAGMISPSSLEGISYSMQSAKILAKIINNKNSNIGRKYFVKTLKIRLKLISKIIKMPFMYNKFLRKIIMKSGLKTIKK
jgi:flavin-dependent dehydrogenase